jgi:hypothetical protein
MSGEYMADHTAGSSFQDKTDPKILEEAEQVNY